jgi:hypothetical protein
MDSCAQIRSTVVDSKYIISTDLPRMSDCNQFASYTTENNAFTDSTTTSTEVPRFLSQMQLSSLFSLPLGCDFSSVPSLQTQVRRSATSKLNYSMDHVTSLECVRLHFSDIERFGYRIYNDKHRGARISIPGRKDPFSPPPLSPAKFSTPKSRLQHTLQLRHDTLN